MAGPDDRGPSDRQDQVVERGRQQCVGRLGAGGPWTSGQETPPAHGGLPALPVARRCPVFPSFSQFISAVNHSDSDSELLSGRSLACFAVTELLFPQLLCEFGQLSHSFGIRIDRSLIRRHSKSLVLLCILNLGFIENRSRFGNL